MNRLQSLAARIAWMPMAVGLASLIIWRLTAWGPLLVVGYGSLAIGVLGAFFVPVLLLRALPKSPATAAVQPTSSAPAASGLRTTLLVTGLALANLPVTFYCAITGMQHATRYCITLDNQAETRWAGLRVHGGGVEQVIGELPPANERSFDVWFAEDGCLELHHGEQGSLVLEPYVTSKMGGSVRVVRTAAGEVRIAPKLGR